MYPGRCQVLSGRVDLEWVEPGSAEEAAMQAEE